MPAKRRRRIPADPFQAFFERAAERAGAQIGDVIENLLGGVPIGRAPAPAPWVALPLPSAATRAQVDAAYRALASVAHPDKATGDAEWFKELTAARDAVYAARGWTRGGARE